MIDPMSLNSQEPPSYMSKNLHSSPSRFLAILISHYPGSESLLHSSKHVHNKHVSTPKYIWNVLSHSLYQTVFNPFHFPNPEIATTQYVCFDSIFVKYKLHIFTHTKKKSRHKINKKLTVFFFLEGEIIDFASAFLHILKTETCAAMIFFSFCFTQNSPPIHEMFLSKFYLTTLTSSVSFQPSFT